MADTGAAKELVEVKHIAAVLAPEKGRAPVLNKDIAVLTDRMKKEGGKSVFQAEVAEKEDDVMVNFDQMRRVMDDERKRIATETDPLKKGELQKRYDRLAIRYGTYDKLLNQQGFSSMTPEEKRDMTNIMTQLPGFSEAVSLATGGRLTIDQVNKVLLGRGGVTVTPDERKAINAIVEQFANSDKLQTRIAKNLAGLELPAEDAAKMQQIIDLREKIKDEPSKRTQLSSAESTINTFESRPQAEQDRVTNVGTRANRQLTQIEDAYKPPTISLADVRSTVASLTAAEAAAHTAYNTAVAHGGRAATPGATEYADWQKLTRQLTAARALESILTPAGAETDYQDFVKVEDVRTKKTRLDAEIRDIEKTKSQILLLEGERGNYASKFIRKMETALPEEMKRFWNDVVINQAVKAAEAELAIKGEAETGTKTEQQKREDTARSILDKYLKLSYLRYKEGKVVGWDDKAIKDFMHKDLLSRSPRKLTRDMLERIYYKSGEMPDTYRKELKTLLTEMGVGKGTPPMTVREAFSKLPDSWYENMAAQKVPEMLGYAWGRGYYFDRMKLKRSEAEFLRQAYPPEFFEKAFDARQAEFDMAQKMLGDKILDGEGTNRDRIRKIIGEDWTQGSKRLLKTAAVAGAIGAGLYGGTVLLGAGDLTGIAGIETLKGVGEAGKHVALAASEAVTAGTRIAAGAVTKGAFAVEQAIPLPPIQVRP